MNWEKKGLLFDWEKNGSLATISHCSIPFALQIEEDIYRIFFSSRNEKGQSIPYFIDAEVKDGEIKLQVNISRPIMELGQLGTFDDSGIMPSSLLWHEGKIYMYYIGWNPQVTVSYRLSIGLSISEDLGKTFKRVSLGPVCDRSMEEPFFNTAPFVIVENKLWRMWYISCTSWQIINNYPEPRYHVKYAESKDGINWERKGVVCIDYDEKAKAIGRPCVLKKGEVYEMFFSYRDIENYRNERGKGYQIGKAVSVNGIHWKKKYTETGISLSATGWDSEMMEYCHVFEHKGIDYMLYNGNDFGKQGFGFAIRK